MVYTAKDSDVIFGTYDSATDTWTMYRFGAGVKVTDYTERYAKNRVYTIGDRKMQTFAELGYHGTISVEAILDSGMYDILNFALNSGDLTEVTVFYKVGGTWYQLDGVKFDTAKIGITVEDVVKISFEGRYKSRTASIPASIPSATPIFPVSFGSASVTVTDSAGNTYNAFINSFNLNVKQNLADIYDLNNLHPVLFKEQRFEADWDMTVYYTNDTSGNWQGIFDGFSSGEKVSISLSFASSSGTLTVSMANAVIERVGLPSEEANVVKMSISGFADDVAISFA